MQGRAAMGRDKLIVRVLADTGIRVGELVNLTVDDLVERDRTQYLRGGGRPASARCRFRQYYYGSHTAVVFTP
jgi:integrase